MEYGQTQKQRNLRPISRKQARKGKAVDVPSGKEDRAGTGAAIQIPHESTRSGYSSHWKESGRSLAGWLRSLSGFCPRQRWASSRSESNARQSQNIHGQPGKVASSIGWCKDIAVVAKKNFGGRTIED
jgi:hypothetical protein